MNDLAYLSRDDIRDFVMKGRAIYPINGVPYVWDTSPTVNSPEKVLQYECYIKSNLDWKITENAYMDVEFSYWYRDKNLNKIRLSSYDPVQEFKSILDGEQTKNYSAIIISEF